ncbi:hypothetical protein DEO72_LG5g2554 [Vigna unguiculata]|uniref:Uncharacterized protein n=1 Tax=Vigna unguiculata TaxID=3917 RepID=A0A4D6M0Y7_VIGUN|nr:hypothetical protein DEO72_LG5g2554 [Vigna unguiculata]
MEGESRDLAIEIQLLDREWTEKLQNVKLPKMEEIHMQCIYRVPPNIREYNPKPYTPQAVSIGPYHHHNNYEGMEELKLKYLKGFLNRTELPIREFLAKIKDLEEEIRVCYADRIIYNDHDFLNIILVDACFIIELLLRCYEEEEEDPLLQIPLLGAYICIDLILLENQLPFFVLEQLYNLTGMNEKLLDITFDYFERRHLANVCPIESPKHFTDLIRSCIISSSEFGLGKPEEGRVVKHVYSASQLMEAGLEFKLSPNKSLLDLTYSKHDGVLSMPILIIDDMTEVLFKNMMVYEQCHPSAGDIIRQYFEILDFLINTEKDVEILVDKKVIVNLTGDVNKVVTTINNLCSNLPTPGLNSHYLSICNSLNEFYENPRNKYKAIFVHEYFNTPWKIASTIAAIVLLLLTFIQTVCSILSLF